MKLFIVNSNICLLKKIIEKGFMRKVNLCKINNDRCKDISLGTNKFIYHLANNDYLIDEEFVGIADAAWNMKFKNTCKMQYLNAATFNNNVIYSPCVSTTWYNDSIVKMPETKELMDDVLNRNSFSKKYGKSIFSNNFVCHKDIMKKYILWFANNFDYFFDKYKNTFTGDMKNKNGFFYERLTSIYFANQDYEIEPILRSENYFKLI